MKKREIGFFVLVLLILMVPAFFFAQGKKVEGKAGLRIALVLNQRRGDRAVVDAMCRGMLRAEKELGVEIRILESRDPTEFSDNVGAMVVWGAKLIFTSFQPLVGPAVDSAKRHPDVKYALIYGVHDNPPENVQCVVYKEDTASYLAGMMAGLKTKSGKVVFTVGADIPTMRFAYNGFVQGVHSLKPEAETFFIDIGSFEDPTKGKEVALSLFSQGVDVISSWAAKCGWGEIEAAQETGNWVCGLSGLEISRGEYGKTVIGQSGVDFSVSVYEITKDLVEGKWIGGGLNLRTLETRDVGLNYEPSTEDGWTISEVSLLKKTSKDLSEGRIEIKPLAEAK